MTRIRPAIPEDAEAIMGLVARFLDETAYKAILPYNPQALGDLITLVLEHGLGCAFLGQIQRAPDSWESVAIIAGIAGAHPITGEGTVEELVWWVNPEARSTPLGPRLIKTLEDWCIQNTHHSLKMVAPYGSDVSRFYERMGYRPIETAYLKRL